MAIQQADSRSTVRTEVEDRIMSDDAVRNRAYELYERRGRENGHDWDDWFEAERVVRQRTEE